MKNRVLSRVVVVAALAAAAVIASPVLAAQEQNVQTVGVVQGSTVDLGMLQRTGPGGDLEQTDPNGGSTCPSMTQPNGGGGGNCPPSETCSECLKLLDAYNANNTSDPNVPGSEFINTVTSANILTSGQPFLVVIQGTVSYWGSAFYTSPVGSPEAHPQFYSPFSEVLQANQGLVASDWEYLFAYPNTSHGANLFSGGPLHIVLQGVSLDNGGTFNDYVPFGGQAYSTNHVYQYIVAGQGQQAQFRIGDKGPHNDNYGQFKICIYKLNPCTTRF